MQDENEESKDSLRSKQSQTQKNSDPYLFNPAIRVQEVKVQSHQEAHDLQPQKLIESNN